MNEPTATRHQRLRRRVRVTGIVSGAVLLSVVALTPISRSAANWLSTSSTSSPAGPATPPGVFASILYVVGLVAMLEVVALPAAMFVETRGVGRSRRKRSSITELLAAHAQTTFVTLGLAIAGALVWSVAVRIGGDLWWAVGAALMAGLLVAALRGAPAMFSRLGAVRPLSRTDLAARLGALARGARVEVAGVHEWQIAEESGASALVTGAGRTRRVLVTSSMLRDWTDDEIAVVVAHELAHHRHHDLHATLVLDAALIAVAGWTSQLAIARWQTALGLSGPFDLAALPFLILVAGAAWVAVTPIRLALSRRQERRADRFALATTGSADAFSTAVRRLGARYLAEERPSRLTRWLFQRHPSVAERVAAAERYRRTSAPA